MLAENKLHIRFVDYFTDRLATLLKFTSALKYTTRKRAVCVEYKIMVLIFIDGNVK